MLLAVAAMAFTGCSNNDEEVVVPAKPAEKFVINADIEASTRTEWNNQKLEWVAGDNITFFYDYFVGDQSTNWQPVWKGQTPLTYDSANKNFSTTSIPTLSNGMQYAAIYPMVKYNENYNEVCVCIESVQDYTTDSAFNGSYAPMVTKKGTSDGTELKELNMMFYHLSSAIEFRFITDDPNLVNQQVKDVTFEANFANNWEGIAGVLDLSYINPNPEQEPNITGWWWNNDGICTARKAITSNFGSASKAVAVADKATAPIAGYMSLKPGTYTGKFVVTIGSEIHTINITDAKPLELLRGHMKPITLKLTTTNKTGDVQTGEIVYTLVDTEANPLLDGDEVIIVAKNFGYAVVGKAQFQAKMDKEKVTIVDNSIKAQSISSEYANWIYHADGNKFESVKQPGTGIYLNKESDWGMGNIFWMSDYVLATTTTTDHQFYDGINGWALNYDGSNFYMKKWNATDLNLYRKIK